MKNVVLSLLALLFFSRAFPQEDLSIKYANTITIDDLKEHLTILASDALEGRETGERGQKMAAAYIEHHFKSNNLEAIVSTSSGKSFLQSFDLIKKQLGNTWIKISENDYSNFEDFMFTGQDSFEKPVKSKLIFVGEGNQKDYDTIPVNDKNVILYCDGDRIARNKKTSLAMENGAKNVFIIHSGTDDDFKRIARIYKRDISSGKLVSPLQPEEIESGYFFISKTMGLDILNTSEKSLMNAIEKSKDGKYGSLLKLKSEEITFYARQEKLDVSTENVLGFIEGTDRKNECIILSAHYDHIGRDGEKINNGADDDGSGTVAILEIAQAFALACKEGHRPRRSILFMTVTGEEKGLLGSSYYVAHPVLPLENTITNLNIDMIGRVDSKHKEKPEYIYIIGSDKLSNELHEISEHINMTYSGLELDYTFNSDSDPNRFYYRSDHYNFAKNNIPVIFYFNGTHADYHRPTDTVDKIEFKILEKRARLIFHTAWEIANRDDRIALDAKPEEMKLESTY